jgi:hypothetical protein
MSDGMVGCSPSRLEGIWIKRVHGGPMDPAQRANLVAGQGLVGNADQGRRRQVTIIEQEVWHELMKLVGSDLPPSTRRANLMISGTSLVEARGRVIGIGLVGSESWAKPSPARWWSQLIRACALPCTRRGGEVPLPRCWTMERSRWAIRSGGRLRRTANTRITGIAWRMPHIPRLPVDPRE